ncbi:MAG: hypothetical protein JWM27_1530 [Gemmatimonadetes bacterium]|nr:hypothetical protein [Gemmatimonadota bacterium]
MPRLLSALLLLAFAWSQAYAGECPLAASARAATVPAHAHHASASAGHPSHGRHAPAHHPDAHHSGPECGAVMACGIPALPNRVASIPVPRPTHADAPRPAGAAYRSPVLSTDPPPPRSLA